MSLLAFHLSGIVCGICFSRLVFSKGKSSANCWARRSAFCSCAGPGPSRLGWLGGLRSLHADGLGFCAAPLVSVNGWLMRAQSGRAPAAFSGNSGVQRSRARASLLIQWNVGDFPKKSEQGRRMRACAVSATCRIRCTAAQPCPHCDAPARWHESGGCGKPPPCRLHSSSPTRPQCESDTTWRGCRGCSFDLGIFPNLGRRNEGRMRAEPESLPLTLQPSESGRSASFWINSCVR